MINKGDLFIAVPRCYGADRSYHNCVFKCLGTQENNVYSEIVGFTADSPWCKGQKVTIDATFFNPVKANRDTIEAAGITVDKKENLVDTTRDEAIDRLTKQKDKDYWKFIDDYIQWAKIEAVNNKNAFIMLAAVIESEAKLTNKGDTSVAKSATKILDTMEAIEVLNKFYESL